MDNKIQKRALGNSKLEVSAIGLGCLGMSFGYGTIADKNEMITIQLETPGIFTTAYDEYALEAFKVNSIDYLLKPIKTEDMKRALDKFKKLTRQDVIKYLSQLTQLNSLQNIRINY
jgi:two-component SAPR family response regulator